MKISILCSDKQHPVYPRLEAWAAFKRDQHEIEVVEKAERLNGGDMLFLLSVSEHVSSAIRTRYRHSLVIHASDLPRGRGWSPWAWQILEGKNEIPVTLLEAEEKIDAGAIWAQLPLILEGHEVAEEINQKLFDVEFALIEYAIENHPMVTPREQPAKEATYYRKRTPEDSRFDPLRPLAEQFDLLRIADPLRYPAFFDYRGFRYNIRIEKVSRTEKLP